MRAVNPAPKFVYLTWMADRESVAIFRSDAAKIIRSERRNSRLRRMKTKTQVCFDRLTRATVVVAPNASLSCAITHEPYHAGR